MNPVLLIFPVMGIVAERVVVLVDKVSLGLSFIGCDVFESTTWTLSCACGRGEEMSVEDEADVSEDVSRVRSSGIVWYMSKYIVASETRKCLSLDSKLDQDAVWECDD